MNWLQRWRGLSFDPPGHAGFLFVLLALVLVAYAVYLYRRSDAPLAPALRTLLTGLRATTLLLLLVVLCRPVLSLALPGGAARGVLVLLDRSWSLNLPGRAPPQTRDAELGRALDAVRGQLEADYPLTVRGFDADVHDQAPTSPPAPPRGESTDLARALERGLAEGGPLGRPGAIVLLSDGTQTAGPDPVPLARRAGVPIEAVALGASTPVPDLAVARVRVNREAFAGERTPVEAVIRLQGLAPAAVQVRLLDVTEGETELATETVRVEGGGAEARVRLAFTPAETGLRFLEVRVPELPGEVAPANNRRLVAVEIRKGKTGVLLLSGSLTWDHTFLRRALAQDSTLALTAGYWKGNAFLPIPPARALPALSAGGLREIRVVILDHVRPLQLGGGALDALAGFVGKGGGLLLMSGSEAGALSSWQGTPLATLLPVLPAGGAEASEVQLRLTDAARRHELFDPGIPGALPLEAWGDLPPVVLAPDLGSGRGGAEVLLVPAEGPAERAAVAWMRSGQGRVVLFGGSGFWNWSFRPGGQGTAAPPLEAWWRRLAHWLSRSPVETQIDIHPEEFVNGRGKPVTFVARVTDDAYQPIPGVEVEVEVSSPALSEGSRRLPLTGSEGIQRGALEGLPPGRYRYQGTARAKAGPLGTVDGVFAVDSLGTEMERLEADHELLDRLARASGGHLWSPDSLGLLGESLRTTARAEEERTQLALWDHPLLFALVVLSASMEWLLRRRRGLV